MGVFQIFRISKSTNAAYFLSSSYPSEVMHSISLNQPINQRHPCLSFLLLGRDGSLWFREPDEIKALFFKECELEAGHLAKPPKLIVSKVPSLK